MRKDFVAKVNRTYYTARLKSGVSSAPSPGCKAIHCLFDFQPEQIDRTPDVALSSDQTHRTLVLFALLVRDNVQGVSISTHPYILMPLKALL